MVSLLGGSISSVHESHLHNGLNGSWYPCNGLVSFRIKDLEIRASDHVLAHNFGLHVA